MADKPIRLTAIVDALRASKVFSCLSETMLTECASGFTFLAARKHRRLFQQGDACTLVYCLIKGLVHLGRVTEDGCEFTARIVCRGDIFGEESLFDEAIHSRSARTLDDCVIAACRADCLKALLIRCPVVGLNLARCLQERHEEAIRRIQRITLDPARDRLLAVLYDLAAKCGVHSPNGTRLDAALTHVQLASLIGTTRETVSFELKALEREGHVLRQGRTIVLTSLRKAAA